MTSPVVYQFLTLSLLFSVAKAQLDAFLPGAQNYAPKPTITPDLVKYFELDGHARELVDTLIGPRPGGFFPEKTYEIAEPPRPTVAPAAAPDDMAAIVKNVDQFLASGSGSPPSSNNQEQLHLPPGFGQGFSLQNGKTPVAAFQDAHVRKSPVKDDELQPPPSQQKSSISGIPSDFPKLPKFPFSSLPSEIRRQQPVVLRETPDLPKFASKPEVPEGGMGPTADIRRHPASVSEALTSSAADASEYGTLTDEPQAPGGLIGTVLDLFGFNKDGKPSDANGIGKAVTNLLSGNNSPLPGKGMISNVLYKALTSGSVQPGGGNGTAVPTATDLPSLLNLDFNASTPLTLNAAQQQAIGENLEMIQNLIVQPSSPLCNPKPVPVSEFNLEAFMGQWYQVVYSPPLTPSACSVVTYRKLADVNNGGIGSIFEVFEYISDGTPYSKPRINSGYAILKQAGELIFRTTAHQEDVNIHVIFTGPENAEGEYDFVILSTNCNYPIYVFARDPVVYKQKYETAVFQMLEQKGIVNGISKMLNIVAPVDSSSCTFPSSLFNFKG